MKKILTGLALTILMSGFLITTSTFAQDFRSGDSVRVAASETVDGSLYASGSTITINGTVNGDVYCMGQSVTIDGTINGDVLCAAQTLRVSGTVSGDVRLAGMTVTLDASVGSNASIFAQTITIDRDASINGDLTGAAQSATLAGALGRDLTLGSQDAVITGRIGRDIAASIDNLTIEPGALVGGNVAYTSDRDARIARGTVSGQVRRTQEGTGNRMNASERGVAAATSIAYTLLSFLLLALTLVFYVPHLLHRITDTGRRRPGLSLLAGVGLVFGGLPLIFLLLLTVIGIPLAALLFLLWLIVVLLGGPAFAYHLGRLVLPRDDTSPMLVMLVGALTLSALFLIPFINFFVFFAMFIFGSGMVLLSAAGSWRRNWQSPYKQPAAPDPNHRKSKP